MASLSDLIAARFGLPSETGRQTLSNDTVAQILGHRTIRRYEDKDVPVDLVNVLLACAQSAPGKSDLQQYSIIQLTDAARKQKLSDLSGTAAIATAPIVLVFCADIRRVQRISDFRDKPYVQNTVDSFMNAAVDASLAMQNFTIAV